jgi:esterase/lipase superfamily enzyme
MDDATIFFATNRKPNDASDPTDVVLNSDPIHFGQASFSNVDLTPENDERSDAVLATLGGAAQITVAQEVVAPQDGSATTLADKQPFDALLRNDAGKQEAILVPHGYDYRFRESPGRAAQLQKWFSTAERPLMLVLLAWPSAGLSMSPST